jgi:hypothetical protein
VSESPTPTPRPRLTPWLAAIGVLAVAVVAFGAVQLLGDDDDGDNAGTTPATVTEIRLRTVVTTAPELTLTESVPATTPGGPEPPDPEPGTLRIGRTDLYPALEGSLAGFANQQVEGKRVEVLGVNGSSSLWVGRREGRQLLVVVNLKGQPFPRVQEGRLVDLVGQIRPNQGNHGVTDAQGRAILERQGHHAFVSVLDLKLR